MTRHGVVLDSEDIRKFCRKWKIRELKVFGSILREDFRPESDIDFLADFDPDAEWDAFDHLDMEDELTALVGRKVDLVGLSAVESSKNRFRKKEILSTAEPVVAKR